MGGKVTTQLEKDLGNDFPQNENLAGFENNSNICYSNSVLQTLYHCSQFRKEILNYSLSLDSDKTIPKVLNDNPLLLLKEIFEQIIHAKKKVNVLNIKKFMQYVRKNNAQFQGETHQDSHEFLIWYLNQMNDILEKQFQGKAVDIFGKPKTMIKNIFQGIQQTSTFCMRCKNTTVMNEPFLALSVEIEDNFSLNQCLKNFNCVETLKGNDQFDCEKCRSKQDAEKRVSLAKLPEILIIQLKRFKYDEQQKKMIKLTTKIAFSHEIRINYGKDNENQLYELYAIIVHIGPGQYGHYVTIVKNHNKWLQFDDENIKVTLNLIKFAQIVEVNNLKNIYGSTKGGSSACAYMLFYEMIDKQIQYDF